MNLEPDQIIASRRYFSARDPFKTLEVQIGKPIPSSSAADEFFCAVGFNSSESEQATKIYGIDSLQALVLALSYAKAKLQSEGSDWRWLDDESVGIDIVRI